MRLLAATCVIAVLMFPAVSMAGGVAYVDYATLMREAPQVRASEKLLRQEYAPRLKKIIKLEHQMLSLRKQLRDISLGTNALKRASIIENFNQTRKALQQAEQQYRAGLRLRRSQLLDNFKRLVDTDVRAYAKAHGIDLVIDTSGMYVGRKVDATKTILNRLREQYRKAHSGGKSGGKQ